MTTNMRELFLLQEDVVFLNHGSFGACPRPVFEAYQAWQLELERQPVAFLDEKRNLRARMHTIRNALATEIGAQPADIVGVTNATAGLNIVAQSLNLEPGDEILTSSHEYAALEKTWDHVATRTGAEIVVAEIALPLVSEKAFTQTFVDAITPRTKVLFLSHITSPTALLFPIENILKIAREKCIITIIDGAHAPGLIDLNLDALGADFYAGNCHKWMLAPKGSAFLWARREMQHILEPLVVSHGWVRNTQAHDQEGAFGNSRFIDNFDVQGTRDPAGWLAVPAAIEFKQQHDWQHITRQAKLLAQDTADALAALTGLEPLSSPEFSAGQMIAIPLPDCDVESIKHRLIEDYNIEIPVFKWRDHCFVRLSVQAYNTANDTRKMVDALCELIPLQSQTRRTGTIAQEPVSL